MLRGLLFATTALPSLCLASFLSSAPINLNSWSRYTKYHNKDGQNTNSQANSNLNGRTRPPDLQPLQVKPAATRFEIETPLAGAPSIIIDKYLDRGSIASDVAKNRNLQSRIMWIDGTANLDAVNTEQKINGLVAKIKDSGFNTIVFDVKPICGETLYPSRFAPKLTKWKDQSMPLDFDPLKVMARDAKADGISLIVSMNAFSEGHQLFHIGPGYQNVSEQSVLYEPKVTLKGPSGETFPCDGEVNEMPSDSSEIGVFNDSSKLPSFPIPGAFAVTMAPGHRVVDGFEGGGAGADVPTIPSGGALLIGTGLAADYLRRNAVPGSELDYVVAPHLIPIGERPNREYPLMMNPNDPQVQNHILDMVREVTSEYPIDGVIFDDRLRYAGFDADFSDTTRQQFETFVGHPVNWPDSCYRYSLTTDFHRGIIPGPDWDAWIQFRALTVRNFLARVRNVLNSVNPDLSLGVYAGSWYGNYYTLGANWASPDFRAGFWSLTPPYQKTGFADIIDLLITGCYYNTATVHQALAEAQNLGETVESAGALSNRAANNECWTVAGISVSNFQANPSKMFSLLSAACASTQGVMVFDYSYITDPMWAVFKQAFSVPAKPVQLARQSLDFIRKQEQYYLKKGIETSPTMILSGQPGIGQ